MTVQGATCQRPLCYLALSRLLPSHLEARSEGNRAPSDGLLALHSLAYGRESTVIT